MPNCGTGLDGGRDEHHLGHLLGGGPGRFGQLGVNISAVGALQAEGNGDRDELARFSRNRAISTFGRSLKAEKGVCFYRSALEKILGVCVIRGVLEAGHTFLDETGLGSQEP